MVVELDKLMKGRLLSASGNFGAEVKVLYLFLVKYRFYIYFKYLFVQRFIGGWSFVFSWFVLAHSNGFPFAKIPASYRDRTFCVGNAFDRAPNILARALGFLFAQLFLFARPH